MAGPAVADRPRCDCADLLVTREVLCLLTPIVAELIEADRFPWLGDGDLDVENANRPCEECDGIVLDWAPCGYCDDEGETLAEPLEWWAVSTLLARDLAARGELIVRGLGAPIWGRATSGQAISMDGVIERITDAVGWGGHGGPHIDKRCRSAD